MKRQVNGEHSGEGTQSPRVNLNYGPHALVIAIEAQFFQTINQLLVPNHVALDLNLSTCLVNLIITQSPTFTVPILYSNHPRFLALNCKHTTSMTRYSSRTN